MTYTSDPAFLVLHAVRLKGVGEGAAVARASGLELQEVEQRLDLLAGRGQLEHRESRPAGWRLTQAGVEVHARLVAEELVASGVRAEVEEAYRQFLQLNPGLLAACTAWQLREVGDGVVVNDHTDAAYDAEVVERLVALHRRVLPVVGELAARLARFCRYVPRLEEALDHVVGGEGEWFTRPSLDSYHSVWFELHQDLLDTLAIDRGAEAVTA